MLKLTVAHLGTPENTVYSFPTRIAAAKAASDQYSLTEPETEQFRTEGKLTIERDGHWLTLRIEK